MPLLVVSDLVGHDRDELCHAVVLDERVEEPDPLMFAEAGKERIRL